MTIIVQITDIVRLFRIKTFRLLRRFTAIIPIIVSMFTVLFINPAFIQVFINNIEPLIETTYHYPIHQYQTWNI